ncbi:MAG TPA: chorismate synthase [Acholeplasmataceae bacterium]|nr:chorismate synthase [Acholeplasmataceae bacterium]
MSILSNNLKISFFGESHGKYIGLTIHNFPSNIIIDLEKIKKDLEKRSSFYPGKSKRTEADEFEIISGYFNNKTTGTPLTIIVPNKDVKSKPYLDSIGLIRPSHGDLTQYIKYQGAHDYRGGGHLSGRLTVLYTILGSICEAQLEKQNIKVHTRIKSLHEIEDESEVVDFSRLDDNFPVSDEKVKQKMFDFLERLENDSVGGIVEAYCIGVPAGLGTPLFNSVESVISKLIFSIPGVKGIEFGKGFAITKEYGSKANDELEYQNGKLKFLSNNSGGIQGGITNGEVINFKVALKPTPSINKPLRTINYLTKENVVLNTIGRHDKTFVPKACHVIKSITAYAIYDLLLGDIDG